jgi:glycosyltransferase involved in cell wall biosynthesis
MVDSETHMTPSSPRVAVIIPVSERYDSVAELYNDYKRAIQATELDFEFTYVLDGEFPEVLHALQELQRHGEPLRIVKLAKWFGEATALSAGFENSQGEIILTLPAYHQVEAAELPRLIKALDGADMVVVRRFPRADSRFNRMQTGLFNWFFRAMTGSVYRDLGCGARAFKRQVATEIPVYGDQHRFLPLLASQQGFTVREVDLAQSTKDRPLRVYRPGVYPRRMLDLLTVFFLAKFTKKPLRFFGLVGIAIFAIGALGVLYLVADRLVFDVALAERPALLLSSLLMVLGAQVFALGLVGELVIFTHAREIKEYTIDRTVN